MVNFRYLLYLTLTLLNDEAYGIFSMPPPEGALPELEMLREEVIPAAEWEVDKTWSETLEALPDDYTFLECSVHQNMEDCHADHRLDKV